MLDLDIKKLQLSEYIYDKLYSVNINTIGELISKSTNELYELEIIEWLKKETIPEIIYSVHRLGLNFSNEEEIETKSLLDILKEYSYEELLDKKIEILNSTPKTVTSLKKKNITTIQKIINLSVKSLTTIINKESSAEVIETIYKLGFNFSKEKHNISKEVTNSKNIIDNELDEEIENIRTSIKKYNELMEEKRQLLIKINELDEEIQEKITKIAKDYQQKQNNIQIKSKKHQ